MSFLNVASEFCERMVCGSLFHDRVVSGKKDRWNLEVLFSGIVSVFEFRSVLTVSVCRGRGRDCLM